MLNLINGDIMRSNLFNHMPLFDEVYYDGYLEGKVRKYKAIREDVTCQVLVLNVIRADEKVLWEALEDLFKRSVIDAAARVHGVYVFDMLTSDIHNEVKTFSPAEFTKVIINNTNKCAPGEQRLIKYSSCYGLLQKMIHEDWGKITFKTAVEVFKDKPEYLDLLVKQLIKNFEYNRDPGILLLNDLSMNPLFDPQDTMQQERLKVMLDKQIPHAIEFPPEVYIQDKNMVRELLSGSVIF